MELVVTRYASALFSAASKSKTLAKIKQEMELFNKLTLNHPPLAQLLSNPTIDSETKSSLLKDVLKSKQFSPLYNSFISLLVSQKRLANFGQIYTAFKQMMDAHEGEIAVRLTTAISLDEQVMKKLKQLVVSSFTKQHQKVHFESAVDKSLMGGLVVQVGNKTLDLSVASRLREAEREILLL
jgi:F-type H+-transporting ATPase subunit O